MCKWGFWKDCTKLLKKNDGPLQINSYVALSKNGSSKFDANTIREYLNSDNTTISRLSLDEIEILEVLVMRSKHLPQERTNGIINMISILRKNATANEIKHALVNKKVEINSIVYSFFWQALIIINRCLYSLISVKSKRITWSVYWVFYLRLILLCCILLFRTIFMALKWKYHAIIFQKGVSVFYSIENCKNI